MALQGSPPDAAALSFDGTGRGPPRPAWAYGDGQTDCRSLRVPGRQFNAVARTWRANKETRAPTVDQYRTLQSDSTKPPTDRTARRDATPTASTVSAASCATDSTTATALSRAFETTRPACQAAKPAKADEKAPDQEESEQSTIEPPDKTANA